MTRAPSWPRAAAALALALAAPAAWTAPPAGGVEGADAAAARHAVEQMKESPRGPFSGIKWFCKDGRVLAPKDYACAAKGQGWQHGEWSEATRRLRGQGWELATLLAGIDAEHAVAAPDFADRYAQWLVERFLVGADAGWIYRKARYYRGAVQEEDEREGARGLLLAMLSRDEWTGRRFAALRTGARLLPHGADTASAQKVRDLAASLADRDPAFAPLRVKIHGSPELDDSAAVRDYAARAPDEALKRDAEALATEIERVYRPQPLDPLLETAARGFAAAPALHQRLAAARAALAADHGPASRLQQSAGLLAALREALPGLPTPALRLRALDLSLALEAEHLRAAAELRGAETPSRAIALQRLADGAEAAYGAGLLNAREREALRAALARLGGPELALGAYRDELRYLGLVPGWGTQTLRLHFGEAMDRYAAIEPLAGRFAQDQLRGSPLLAYSQTLDALSRDANRLAGVQPRLLGQDVGAGLHALNPGLARGVLHAAPDMGRVAGFRPDGIYLLSETVSDLPPVAGILTEGAGNPISHVQLLARNLGIPNVAVDASVVEPLRRNDGRHVVLAVSPGGLVELHEDGPRWDAVFGARAQAQDVVFEADLQKLDLSRRDFVGLGALRAADSGRIVGPKAAKLGELKAHFPDRVVPGVALPFGLYRQTVLDRPYRGGPQTVYEWMVERFRRLEALPPGSAEAAAASEALRAEIYATIRRTDPGPRFRERLRAALAREFGERFDGGVFVRSDTNVEDLPGFTGAGLNLTLFNVAGFENLVKAVTEVWASPYTPRAWSWRQSHMKGPEHVYPAVLLLRTVPADLSGVMITQDVDTGDRDTLSVAVNEGVGGAVEGQAAESVRIDRRSGALRLMATASAPRRMVPRPQGGIARLPTSGADTLLQPGEVRQLIDFAEAIPTQFPQLGEDGRPVAADVEFAFVGGRLWLLQIRPFNESRAARGSDVLIEMDRALAGRRDQRIDLREALR